MVVKVCIIGAGVVGLTTATMFQEACADVKVEIIAEKFLGDTTSSLAAGIFRANERFGGVNVIQSKKWLKSSYVFYSKYLRDESFSTNIGVKKLNGYMVSSRDPKFVKNDFLNGIIEENRPCTAEEIATFPSNPKYGTYLSTILVDCTRYLPYLQKKFLSNGGKIKQRRVQSFEELSSEKYDLIFNCCGLGGQELCGDNKVIPLRGQVYKVSAPWLDHFMYDDYDTYIIPGFDAVTLGGTRQYEDYNTNISKYDSDNIWDKCIRSMPALKDAKIIKECVGLRPFRPVIRIEEEDLILSNGKPLRIIHNYGHGAYGVMSAPGTSIDAVTLGLQVLKRTGNISKL